MNLATNRTGLLFVSVLGIVSGCSRPLSPDAVSLEIDSATMSVVRFRIIENAVPLKYISRADISRNQGIVFIKLFQEHLRPDADSNIAIPEISIGLYPTDSEIRLTDGIDEKTVWRRESR